MIRLLMLGAFVLLAVAMLSPMEAPAFTSIGNAWRDAYPDACATLSEATTNTGDCALCHTAGFGFNAYGSDVNNLGIAGADGEDSDGDGRTNAQEILDCTFPGDASSVVANENMGWGAVKALFGN